MEKINYFNIDKMVLVYIVLVIIVLINADKDIFRLNKNEIQSYYCQQGSVDLMIISDFYVEINVYNIVGSFLNIVNISYYDGTITGCGIIKIDIISLEENNIIKIDKTCKIYNVDMYSDPKENICKIYNNIISNTEKDIPNCIQLIHTNTNLYIFIIILCIILLFAILCAIFTSIYLIIKQK